MTTTITALPTPPNVADPTTFNSRANAFTAALPTFGTEVNVVASEVNANTVSAAASASTASNLLGAMHFYLTNQGVI